MRLRGSSLTTATVAVIFFSCSIVSPGEPFLFTVLRASFSRSSCYRSYRQSAPPQRELGQSAHECQMQHMSHRRSRRGIGRLTTPLRMTTADTSTHQQQQDLPIVDETDGVGGMEGTTGISVDNGGLEATQQARPTAATLVRTGIASDRTALVFRTPSTEDMHQLQMGEWVARKGLSTALVAVRRAEEEQGGTERARGELTTRGGPLAGAVIEAMDGMGGSSVATRVCLLRHRRVERVPEDVEHALLDEVITQFLNGGSRINQLRVEIGDDANADFYTRHGFTRSESSEQAAPGQILLSGQRDAALAAASGLVERNEGGAVVLNLLARLLHDAGDLDAAVDAYLKSVQMDPSRSEVFRGLGGAYQSQGQHQMAFASYQQAINVCPTDLLAYLKLGLLYEQLAVGKYEEAGDHAIRCFDYYLQHSGTEDTDVLTRLGNLQLRDLKLSVPLFKKHSQAHYGIEVLRLDPTSAVKTYDRALAVDSSLSNVWFNLANAHLKLGHNEEAAKCLREKVRIDEDPGVSTKYLLASLESDPDRLTTDDQVAYARELFDYYAPSYDDHMRKKLLYTAPRMLRQNVREVYNATFQALPEATRLEHDLDVLSYLNQSLDILDLGCGTGLIGSWFKDYGRKIVGLDVSPTMLDMATKKGCYHELRRGDIGAYLSASDECQFDLVIAAETLQYLGPLETVFVDSFKVLKPGGMMAFTVDRPDDGEENDKRDEDENCDADFDLVASDDDGDPVDTPEVRPGGYLLKTDGTYSCTRPYLVQLARLGGYEIVVLKRHAARVERGNPAPGYMGIFRKPKVGD